MVDKRAGFEYEELGEQTPEVDNSELYKKFGRENEVGKLLYGMYA